MTSEQRRDPQVCPPLVPGGERWLPYPSPRQPSRRVGGHGALTQRRVYASASRRSGLAGARRRTSAPRILQTPGKGQLPQLT